MTVIASMAPVQTLKEVITVVARGDINSVGGTALQYLAVVSCHLSMALLIQQSLCMGTA